jgi:acyl-CoA thioesterase FadM
MRTYEYRRIVQWGECDPARIIFFPNYFRWMEEGLSGMARAHGVVLQPRTGPDAMAGTPAVSINARFLAPARLGDEVRHEVEVAEVRTRAFRIRTGNNRRIYIHKSSFLKITQANGLS